MSRGTTLRRSVVRYRSRAAVMGVAAAALIGAVNVGVGASAPPDQERKGGSVTVALNGPPLAIDPSLDRISFSYGIAVVGAAIFGHLAYVEPATGAVKLYFLESLEPNEDASVWTMRLHPNIKFSDGTPLDAEAIKYNIERTADPDTGSAFQGAAEGLEMTVVDDLTLEVALPEPNRLWDANVVANLSAVGSPTAIQAALDAGEEPGSNPVGAGPFMIDDWDPGARVVLKANPYFKEFKPGQPYLDELVFEAVPDDQQRVNAVTSGAAQMALVYFGNASNELIEKANAVITTPGGANTISLNTSRPPFDDVRARRALALALDRSVIGEAINPGSPLTTGLFPEGSPFYNPEYTWPEQDHDEAQRLFDELAAEGRPVEFSYTTNDSATQADVTNALIAQLAEYDNVSITPDVRTQNDYTLATKVQHDFQSSASCVCFTAPVPGLYDYVTPGGIENYSDWENDDVTASLTDLFGVESIEEQRAIWDVVQRELVEEMPILFFTSAAITLGYADGLIAPVPVNLGTYPIWAEVGYE